MHCNYHFLKQLEKPLKKKLIGLDLIACFSQEKNELILGFGNKEHDWYIRCSVSPLFSAFYFSDQFHRAKKNSVNLWQDFLNEEVINVQIFKNERALGIYLSNEKTLVFKMYGNRANILAFKSEHVEFLFNQKLVLDKEILLSKINRDLPNDFNAFKEQKGSPIKLFPTWGKLVNHYFNAHKTGDIDKDWELVNSINFQLDSGSYFLSEFREKQYLSLIKIGEILQEFSDPIAANNAHYIAIQKMAYLAFEKNAAIRQIGKDIKLNEQYIKKASLRLKSIKDSLGNLEIGHLIMAHLYEIKPKSEFVVLKDFVDQKPIKIRLKKDISAQKNAENYYRKAKKEKFEIDFIENNIRQREIKLISLNENLELLQTQSSLRELRKFTKVAQIQSNKKKTLGPKDLFKHFEISGYQIFIGKNAKNNDVLTLKYASKDDLWLHAKDVSGSHVIIKVQAGKNTPNMVIESAASLAAWFSKRKTDGLVPVACTQKKYVRKIKGALPGKVIVEKEEVFLVEPIDPKAI